MKVGAESLHQAIMFCFPRLEAVVVDGSTIRVTFEGKSADLDLAAMQTRDSFKEALRVATESVGWKP